MVYHFNLPPSSTFALQAQVDEALKRADEMIEDYRKERRQARCIAGYISRLAMFCVFVF